MSLSARRGHTAAAKATADRRRAARRAAGTQPRPCQMPGCRNKTTRPLGYCDTCWSKTPRQQ